MTTSNFVCILFCCPYSNTKKKQMQYTNYTFFSGKICAYVTKRAFFQHTNIVLNKNCLTNNR